MNNTKPPLQILAERLYSESRECGVAWDLLPSSAKQYWLQQAATQVVKEMR